MTDTPLLLAAQRLVEATESHQRQEISAFQWSAVCEDMKQAVGMNGYLVLARLLLSGAVTEQQIRDAAK